MSPPTQSPESYDSVFGRSSSRYNIHYSESPYFELWKMAIGLIGDKNAHLLEIGCGTGQFAHMLYDAGYRNYFGFDWSEVAVRMAKSFSPQTIVAGNAYDAKMYKTYDIAVALEIFEHLADDMAVVSLLALGKQVVFTVPDGPARLHERYFLKEIDVINRYGKAIDIRSIKRHSYWYLCDGIKNRKAGKV